ncbi:histone PARylation factor 1 isoform 1-T1 [Clarias gariepinus]|uniref:histone PARylation factor 1 isoform X1 n=1 Tax=Clarias gariepinus TaxID=13013 RepID=UPI00234CB9F6|nr:histone PARylation factor 1 isoform X1 [Clarias gariepinus]
MAARGKRKAKAAAQASEQGKRPRFQEAGSDQGAGPSAPAQVREEVERLYGLRMPLDFYHFWDFCSSLRPDDPQDALRDTVGVHLVGPFDVVCGKHSQSSSKPNLHLHWRHYYDPPEFQTVLQGNTDTHLHLGYYRDSPDALPVFVGENEAKKGCTITQMGENLFAAVLLLIDRKKRKEGGKGGGALRKLEVELKKKAEQLGLPLEKKTKAMKQRDKKVVSKTFHGAGIVVPVDKNDVGYRELPETDAELKRVCKAIAEAESDEVRMKAFAPLQEIMTLVQFANDEGDYGMALELGLDLFCYGSHYLSKTIGNLLPLAYSLLQRNLFAEIITAHLANRSHDDLDKLAAV